MQKYKEKVKGAKKKAEIFRVGVGEVKRMTVWMAFHTVIVMLWVVGNQTCYVLSVIGLGVTRGSPAGRLQPRQSR